MAEMAGQVHDSSEGKGIPQKGYTYILLCMYFACSTLVIFVGKLGALIISVIIT